MKNFKERLHILWLGLAVLIMLIESALFSSIWTSFAASEQGSIHTHQVLETIESLHSEMKDAETGQRGYLLTGKDSYLEPYNKAVQALPGRIAELRKLTSDNPQQQSRMESLRSLVTEKLAELKETIELQQTHRSEQAIKVVTSDRGKQTMDGLRVVIQAMRDNELSLLDQKDHQRRGKARLLILAMASGSVVLLIVLLAGSRAIDRGMTHRALAEAAERTQREWLQVTLSSIGDGVIATDSNGRVVLINPVAARLTGWSPQEAHHQPLEAVFQIVNEETGNPVENPALRAMRDGKIVALANHTVLIGRGGKRIPLDDSGAPIVDPSGNVLGAVLIFRDVSEKKAREADLFRRDRILRFSFDAIIITDGQRRIQSWNRGAFELYGWDEGEARDKIICDFLRTSPERAARDEILLQQGQWRGELEHTCKDGRVVIVESRQVLLRDPEGDIECVLEINRDITKRKQVAAALAASERRLHALLDSASQGIVAVDERGCLVLVNAKTEEMFGYARGELLGQPLEVILPERYRKAHGEHLRHYFAQPRTRVMGLGLDLCGLTKKGNEFPLEVSLSCIEQGGSRLAMALATDITERKKAEERLRQAQKLESLGLMAGGLAHDFNNLLVGVIGNASMAQDLLPPDSLAAELLEGVVKSGQQAAHLTRQMLAYSGKGRFMVERLDLSALVPEMRSLVQPSLAKKIAISFDLDPDLPAIDADRGQVQQVFMNLVLNAGEAIGRQDGQISIRTCVEEVDEPYPQPHPGAAALRPGKYVCLEVRDTGCGMDDATQTKIFDPFFSTKFIGRGLGLAAVSGIMRGHKGSVTVRSAVGKGSCFTVLFPAVEQAAKKPPVCDIAPRGTGVVLMVDDEPVVREMAKKALETYGYTVLLAESGMAAIDVFRRHTSEIAVLVLDLSMPNMGGDEALLELRKIRPEVKVVVSSGYSEAETMTLFRGQRVSGFLQKPYTSKELAEKVKACVG